MRSLLPLALLIGWVVSAEVSAQDARSGSDRPRAFLNATLIPIDQPPIEEGVLVIRNGKILAIGRTGDVTIPPDAIRIDASDRVIMPGLVCTHSHIGGVGGGDGSSPIQPGVRVFDSINVRDPGFRRAVAGGLTTLNIMPGSGHLISGQTVYVKLRPHPESIEDLFYVNARGEPLGGLKMANGTNPMSSSPPFPGTRGKSAALVREAYIKAREYQQKVEAADGERSKLPPRDLGLEALIEAMNGERIVHHHTHRADDIMTVLRLSEEFGFRVVLHHVSEGGKVAREISEAGVPCSIILVDSPGGKLEAINLEYETGSVLHKAGVKVAFHTDDWITDSRHFRRMAALGVRSGMPRDAALRAITLSGAEMLDLDGRIGSLTPGKDADFVVLNGDPLSVYTDVLETWVEGTKVFDRKDPEDRLHAVGGFGAGNDREDVYFCCQDHDHLGQ